MGIVAGGADSDPRRNGRDLERLRFQIAREWRSSGRFDYSEAEITAEIARRLRSSQARRAAAGQGQLPLLDVGQVAGESKRAACRATRNQRIARRIRIVELLEAAGTAGMLREELAAALDVKEGAVSSAVRYLLDRGEACEPFTRASSCGHRAAVVVLSRYAGGDGL